MTAREPESGTAPEALRALAEQLATEAAGFVRRRRREVFAGTQQDGDAVRTKSSPTDPVTVVDTETERLLRDRLAELRPGDPILGEEEGGALEAPAGVPVWVLDPIDGTVNFMYGLGAYAVSVGVQVDGVSAAGAVANVATGEVFSAARGHGSVVTRDGVSTALRCNVIDELPMALVATGFAYARDRRRGQAAAVAELLAEVRDIRRIGSCALDLCMVAAGQLDAYFESGVHVWDWAAAALIAEEAGAVVRLPEPDAADDDLVIAAAPGVAAALTAQLERIGYR
ncbi:inositol monophosphatase [Mycobacterium sp. CBMA293]|uniref:inositol monophosphatase family protein n=1 Tax=unclassified Mycolicibacterium TaxID=2636767 RepID=UPI0012DDC74B|nr:MULTISPECIES: inositol monophosphatase family protein [unclassified Mycolicibacterium]MUL44840.1 inositol monophosphatase [Mycolicibacterium sp. CBMA 360]MUL58051.1 inositol monophosphatase [Mycolicibacterium sp. CBMA 335]MUL73509.1 inositol monophosphatase [Mycolicibacterium sp. CBMA 311]MUL95433.1 inositol monophosphatase [Mycolicibacterium sp. CBMA 230]MUM07483.1 inositol monophosphatase [Mycolicibacterium sp. CBMA 213]